MKSAKASRVIVVAFDGVQSLDAAGPAEVFALAERLGQTRGAEPARARAAPPRYAVQLASPSGGPIRTSSGLVLDTVSLGSLTPVVATPCWWQAGRACGRS